MLLSDSGGLPGLRGIASGQKARRGVPPRGAFWRDGCAGIEETINIYIAHASRNNYYVVTVQANYRHHPFAGRGNQMDKLLTRKWQ